VVVGAGAGVMVLLLRLSDVPDLCCCCVIVSSNLKNASVSSSEKREASETVSKSADSKAGSDWDVEEGNEVFSVWAM